MNTCKNIKDLILTDYIDDEAGAATKAAVDAHLLFCGDCRQFADKVKEDLAGPFKNVESENVPEHLWTAIKDKIENQSSARLKESGFWEKFAGSFFSPRLATALGGFAVIILLSSFVFYHQLSEKRQAQEQGEYLASLWRSSDVVSDMPGNSDQMPLEKYFL